MDFNTERELNGIADMKECSCGRSYCDYFASGVSEWGTSYSRDDIKKIRNIARKIDSNLTKLLAKRLPKKRELSEEEELFNSLAPASAMGYRLAQAMAKSEDINED